MAGVADLVERWNNGFVGSSAPAYGEQCADTDGLAAQWAEEALSATTDAPVSGNSVMIELLQARIARKEAANWRAECSRLSVLLVETQTQLAQRMALPANALRHSR